ncbi:MAG: hypothetical protein WCG67_04385, partial [Ferruginibacter sp.]
MQPELYYKKRMVILNDAHRLLLKKKSLLAWLRFGTAVVLIAAIYLLLPMGIYYTLFAILLLLFVFIRLVLTDIKNNNAIQHNLLLQKINEEELMALTHQYYEFAEGNEFLPAAHPYANDLDIFGRASLFQYCNRTCSDMGGFTLSNWLLQPATINEIANRQKAIKELCAKT